MDTLYIMWQAFEKIWRMRGILSGSVLLYWTRQY